MVDLVKELFRLDSGGDPTKAGDAEASVNLHERSHVVVLLDEVQ
jgi:hypothetical protein